MKPQSILSPLWVAGALVLGLMPSSIAGASPLAIQKMAGCFEVTFEFAETFLADSQYAIRSKPYVERGLEWVEVDTTSVAGEIGLQHILVTPQGPLKHWRQEWALNPQSRLQFLGTQNGVSSWKTLPISTAAGSGRADLWLQRVGQVDDSPRYECAAQWVFSGDASTADEVSGPYWECIADSPLPRREFTQRSDYQILRRRNRHALTDWGWVHEQDNTKVALREGKRIRIADEKGINTYRRVDEARCATARLWWAEQKSVWHVIQAQWMHIRSHHPELNLKGALAGKTLWMALFELAEKHQQESRASGILDEKRLSKEAHDLIHLYFVE